MISSESLTILRDLPELLAAQSHGPGGSVAGESPKDDGGHRLLWPRLPGELVHGVTEDVGHSRVGDLDMKC